MSYRLFVDMDGVLADFDEGYRKANRGVFLNESVVGADAFWDVVLKEHRFWDNLPLMGDAPQLWSHVSKLGYPVAILSAPASRDDERCRREKTAWFRRHLCRDTEIIFRQARDKKEFAHPDAILIDDNERNVNDWIGAGGIGVKHLNADRTIHTLNQIAWGARQLAQAAAR